jgi:hypothetical protein
MRLVCCCVHSGKTLRGRARLRRTTFTQVDPKFSSRMLTAGDM